MNRSELSRLLAQVLAYLACGKPRKAEAAAQSLVDAFRSAGLEVK